MSDARVVVHGSAALAQFIYELLDEHAIPAELIFEKLHPQDVDEGLAVFANGEKKVWVDNVNE